MRRDDREITDFQVIRSIFNEADVCRIAFADNNIPYIVTMNYGFILGERNLFYFHCAPEGRKIDMLRKNDQVCFELDTDHKLIKAKQACGWGMSFRSVVGYGKISVVEDLNERKLALDHIMNHYGGEGKYDYPDSQMAKTTILRLDITEMTGKQK
jgi:nitroimidazol reductase NimA-like FMN-containing flavoprotein (pyridoxamine 5'-phosphate oxidase superfamily)